MLRSAGGRLWHVLRRATGLLMLVSLGGVAGVLWWFWPRIRGRGPRVFKPRFGRATAVALFGLLVFGAVFRTGVAINGVNACTNLPATPDDPSPRILVNAEKAILWPVTGIGMAYAQLRHGRRCYISAASFYFDEHHHSFWHSKSFTIGDAFLSRFRAKQDVAAQLALFNHERHHRRQWAISSVIAGHFAFPLSYTVDDFFFPGNRNHFEQEAGLARGGYDPNAHDGPRVSPIDLGLLVVLAGSAEGLAHFRRRRRPAVTTGA